MAVKKTSLFFVLSMLLAWAANAQQFRVGVSAPAGLGRNFELWVYDSEAAPRVLKPSGKRGSVYFTGSVRGAVYAELRHKNVLRPLPLFVDNAEIAVAFDADNPEASRITGARQNSVMRYQLEQCGTTDAECLSRFVAENPSSPVAPYILERYVMPLTDYETVQHLYGLLAGEAREAYHYRHLGRRLKVQAALAAGSPLPAVTYTDRQGRAVALDTLLATGRNSVLLVGSTYCSQCAAIRDTLSKAYPEVSTVAIDVDKIAGEWDAPLMQTLDIDHIPYLILVDAERRIVARDIRIWELRRCLGEMAQVPAEHVEKP